MENHNRSFVRRYQILLFFILAFVLSWLVWGSAIAQQYDLLLFRLPDPLAFFGISLAAFIVTGLVNGWVGIRDLLQRMIRWRVGFAWYLITLGLAIGLPLIAAGIYQLVGGIVPLGQVMPLGSALGYFAFSVPFMLLTEETAWRGYALPRLQTKYLALPASLILGLIWGIWACAAVSHPRLAAV